MMDNKNIMAENLRYYLEKNNMSATDLCKELNIGMSTFSSWLTARA